MVKSCFLNIVWDWVLCHNWEKCGIYFLKIENYEFGVHSEKSVDRALKIPIFRGYFYMGTISRPEHSFSSLFGWKL